MIKRFLLTNLNILLKLNYYNKTLVEKLNFYNRTFVEKFK
jgi:hypothetical protein